MQQAIQHSIQAIDALIIGKQFQVKLAISCLLAGGHLLIEDLPGMGKTTLSHGLANVLGLNFSRVQFTSDLLPADVLGVSIFDAQKQQFSFHPGPIFNNVVLTDEINRASPKTQSALLEAMEEHQVSIDGSTYTLPRPFFVIATQNPLHQAGTYPLPESQLDRFLMRIQLGYPNRESEKAMLLEQQNGIGSSLPAFLTQQQLIEAQQRVIDIKVSNAIVDYILRLVTLSRESELFPNPLSPRASKAVMRCAKSWAFVEGRSFVIPEDIQAIFPSVAEHRLRSSQSDIGNSQNLSEKLLSAVDPLAS
ncbi:AAA family ATPase [Neptunicella sp. SCSIO 80796]|uniref:AAA family ATPase n=1 Tax=Neptunicella plasticusilytica TaxID=3117012 RepID=UPI003A4DB9BA